jgi:hypothetical protein
VHKTIKAEVQNMSAKDILSLIPNDTIERLRKTDKSVEKGLKAYVVGHEGTANAQELTLTGKVRKAFHYVKDMIIKLGEKIAFGLPLYYRHGTDNTGSGRERIGEVVGKKVTTVKDKLSTVVAAYIYPKFRALALNSASIEADIEYMPKTPTQADVIDIVNVSGVALSDKDIPAFPGASLLGIVQQFQEGDKMTKEDILQGIRELGLKITDIFSKEDIIESEPAKEYAQKNYEHAKRVEKKLGEEREKIIEITKEKDDLEKKLGEVNSQLSSVRVTDLYTKTQEARKLDDKQKAFIQKNLKGFKSDKDGDDLKVEFEKFVDKQLDEYDETAKLFGIEKGKKKDGVGSGDGKGLESEDDYEDPEKNPMIPEEE